MTDPNLQESAWRRATADAGRIYPTTAFEVAATLMAIIFGAIAAVASSTENTTTQIAAPIIGGALALLVTFGVVFVVQLASAPMRQRNELRAAWEPPTAIETVNVDLTLRNAHRRGHELAQLLEARQGVARGHREEIDAWVEEVVALLAAHLPDEAGQQFIAAGQSEAGPVRRLRLRVEAFQKIIDAREVDRGLE